MANFGLTKLEFFNQHDERNRVLDNMERLLHADDAFYIPRPIIPDKFVDQVIPTVGLITVSTPFICLVFWTNATEEIYPPDWRQWTNHSW